MGLSPQQKRRALEPIAHFRKISLWNLAYKKSNHISVGFHSREGKISLLFGNFYKLLSDFSGERRASQWDCKVGTCLHSAGSFLGSTMLESSPSIFLSFLPPLAVLPFGVTPLSVWGLTWSPEFNQLSLWENHCCNVPERCVCVCVFNWALFFFTHTHSFTKPELSRGCFCLIKHQIVWPLNGTVSHRCRAYPGRETLNRIFLIQSFKCPIFVSFPAVRRRIGSVSHPLLRLIHNRVRELGKGSPQRWLTKPWLFLLHLGKEPLSTCNRPGLFKQAKGKVMDVVILDPLFR